MPTWDDLPLEFRDRVLYFFCLDIIDDYLALTEDFDDCIDSIGSYFNSPSAFLPRSPQSLRDFSSVFQTCRHFRNVLTNIKFKDKSPVEILQTAQYQRLRYIIQGLSDCDGENCNFGEIFRPVGCFWKNSKVLNDPECIGNVLKQLSAESFMILIPHLEDWVLQHTESKSESDLDVGFDVRTSQGVVTLDVEVYNRKGAWLRSGCMSFKKGSSQMGGFWRGIQICSIAGCVTPAEEAACKRLRRRKRGIYDEVFEDYIDEEEDEDGDDSEDSNEGFNGNDDEYVYHEDYVFACDTNLSLICEIMNSDVDS